MSERLSGSWWIENLLRPVLIAAMMACLMTPLIVVSQWLLPGWDGTYLVVFAFLASLEGILSERALNKRGITGWSYFGSRAAEALILLLLLKLVNYIPRGFDRLLADAPGWIPDPYSFVSGVDLFTAMMFLPLWLGSLHVAHMVRDLDVEEGKGGPPPDKTSTEYYLWLTKPSAVRDRQERLTWLGESFLWGGMALLLAASMIHFFVSSASVLALPTLLYFALGVALLSQARFSVTHAGWRNQGMPIQPGIARRWLVWAVIFLVMVALLALLLPTYYSMGPLNALLGLAALLYNLLWFILLLLLYLLSLPLRLFFPNMEQRSAPVLDMAPLTPEPAVGSGPPAWLQVLASSLFWLVVLLIVGYALVRFWRDRFGASAGGEAAKTWWGRFLAWWRGLWQRWWAWQQGVELRLLGRRGARKPEGTAAGISRFFFPGRLSPRELVRYFYLSAARRAAQVGRPRGPGQTPYEYSAALEQGFPELKPDLEGLTEAFVAARYGSQPVQQEDAQAVKPLWQRIKAALQRRHPRS